MKNNETKAPPAKRPRVRASEPKPEIPNLIIRRTKGGGVVHIWEPPAAARKLGWDTIRLSSCPEAALEKAIWLNNKISTRGKTAVHAAGDQSRAKGATGAKRLQPRPARASTKRAGYVRHLVSRKSSSGAVRYYWQPTPALRAAGWQTIRLPDARPLALAEAERQNTALDQWRESLSEVERRRSQGNAAYPRGSLGELIHRYLKAPEFTNTALSTQHTYRLYFDALLKWGADKPLHSITVPDVTEMHDAHATDAPVAAKHIVSRLYMLFEFARRRGEIERNPARGIRFVQQEPREAVWSEAAFEAMIETADRMGLRSIATAILIGGLTAQRPSDILALRWSQYRDACFHLRQKKTKRLVAVPAAPELAARLAGIGRPEDDGPIIINESGAPYSGRDFYLAFCRVRARAALTCPELEPLPKLTRSNRSHAFNLARKMDEARGLKFFNGAPPDERLYDRFRARVRLTFRDLRRTAVVWMAEEGTTEAQIAAVTGHQIESTRRILETYLPRNGKMAADAIENLGRRRERNGAPAAPPPVALTWSRSLAPFVMTPPEELCHFNDNNEAPTEADQRLMAFMDALRRHQPPAS